MSWERSKSRIGLICPLLHIRDEVPVRFGIRSTKSTGAIFQRLREAERYHTRNFAGIPHRLSAISYRPATRRTQCHSFLSRLLSSVASPYIFQYSLTHFGFVRCHSADEPKALNPVFFFIGTANLLAADLR